MNILRYCKLQFVIYEFNFLGRIIQKSSFYRFITFYIIPLSAPVTVSGFLMHKKVNKGLTTSKKANKAASILLATLSRIFSNCTYVGYFPNLFLVFLKNCFIFSQTEQWMYDTEVKNRPRTLLTLRNRLSSLKSRNNFSFLPISSTLDYFGFVNRC